MLAIREGASPEDARLKWKWKNGPQIDVQDFGDPRTTTSYNLCIYDQDAQSPSGLRLMLEANVPSTNASWSPTSTGYKYRDPAFSVAGMQQIVLKSGGAGRGRITLKARGQNLSLANLPASPPVIVQLKTSGGACWGANYAMPAHNTPINLRGNGGP